MIISTLEKVFSFFVGASSPPLQASPAYFQNMHMLSTDPALIARRDLSASDMRINQSYGLPHAFASNVSIPDKTLAVVCAADSLTKPDENGCRRIDGLNDVADDRYIILAGAGHYALKKLKRADAAITNFSAGNSHTRAFKEPDPSLIYFVASHCAAEELSGNKPTLEHLVETLPDPASNVWLYDAYLEGIASGPDAIGAGTGAPPAAVALIAALRHRAGLGPVNVELYGFDGTDKFIMPTDELPPEYQERLKRDSVLVSMDNRNYAVQGVFVDQMRQLAHMAISRPDLIASIKVDNPESLPAKIFNTSDGKPRLDFSIVDPETREPIIPSFDL
jgi:hypothetical protein